MFYRILIVLNESRGNSLKKVSDQLQSPVLYIAKDAVTAAKLHLPHGARAGYNAPSFGNAFVSVCSATKSVIFALPARRTMVLITRLATECEHAAASEYTATLHPLV